MKRQILYALATVAALHIMSWATDGQPLVSQPGNPYVQGIWTKKNPIYFTQGALFRPHDFSYDRTVTEVAVLYHPLSAGSIIPPQFQPWLPPESWACTIGGGYAPSSGGASAAFGCGFNLADSVRGWASNLLNLSANPTAQAAAAWIKPGDGRVNPFCSYQWADSQTYPGRFAPRYSIGLNLGF